jgi:hypothetical protein
MIKKIVPFEQVVYHSRLTKEELLVHLQNEIEAEKSFGFGASNHSFSKSYVGKITNNLFEIKRAISYRNSFLPNIKGEIQNDFNGSKVYVKMNLDKLVKVFMIVWLSLVSIACLAITYVTISNGGLDPEGGFAVFIPFLMLVFGIALVSIGFKVESKRSIKDLEELLKAKIIKQ